MSVDRIDIAEEMQTPAELCEELKSCLHHDERIDMTVMRHPLYVEVPYTPQLNNHYNKQLERLKTVVKVAYENEEWSKYLGFHARPYRLEQFSAVCDFMEDEEYWKILSWLWIDCENLWQYRSVINTLFTTERGGHQYFMNDEERAVLESLPEVITIYRGHNVVNLRGWSWTLNQKQAEWFARRFTDKRQQVTTATVKKSTVIAYVHGRDEKEIIVNPRRIKLINSKDCQ